MENILHTLWTLGTLLVDTQWWFLLDPWRTWQSGDTSGTLRSYSCFHIWKFSGSRKNIHLQVELLVTFVPGSLKLDLDLTSSAKFVGSYQIQLETQKETEDYVHRSLKVRNRGFVRTVSQLVFLTSSVPPNTSSFLALIRESSQLSRHKNGTGISWFIAVFKENILFFAKAPSCCGAGQSWATTCQYCGCAWTRCPARCEPPGTSTSPTTAGTWRADTSCSYPAASCTSSCTTCWPPPSRTTT